MDKKSYLVKLLKVLNFTKLDKSDLWIKNYSTGAYLKADIEYEQLIYPIDQGFKVNGEFTTNFSSDENFVVFECVNRLFEKGYKPEHIELEPKWKLGHGASGGRADIFVRDQNNKPLLIIECKTAGKEFDHAWKKTLNDGDQLFSYIEQEKDVKYVCLYASSLNSEFDQVTVDHKVISHKDNQKILDENLLLDSYSNAKNVKERFGVWQQTYNLEYTESGIFEENIQVYQIGKDKYTLIDDTRAITNADKKGKYNQFATILRKYNVSRKENAFEILVNLFLCKIVDETQNPTDLKFYWKGIAYDNYYDFIDRLQELYKVGMEKYLEQDITYVSNQEIEGAFWAYKNKKNATRNTIQELFKKLKFYNDNNFGFIGVKNKEGFTKNAKILLEVTQMWQSLRLKTKEQNQFLGDMFEFFLDSGVKQSEGQYFTPVPICKFILTSLPLENMVTENTEPLKVIDYACGSGHFLTEYASQIEHIARINQQDPNLFYHKIYGIEKEDRLAKVAKVSAFMYGFDGVNIIDNDALIENPKIQEESFDILIANPPFAVKEFLTTIPAEEREKYQLTATVSDINTNDDIQNFFLERAKQLLNKGGIAGIVVPNTILTNTDKISVQTREILLRYFNFVSIVELPPSTFGKTGTNTVVIYLERKSERPEGEVHYKDRVNSFFNELDIDNKDFKDKYLIENYCLHSDFNFEDYLSLLQNKPNETLLSLEIFKEYQSSFNNQTEIKNLIKSRQFLAKPQVEQRQELAKKFTNYLVEIEKDKLYYFILANTNPKPVLIVRCPADTKEQKKFVGYEWSGSKGSEGIRYNGGDTVHDISTIMFNPKDRNDTTKISYYIRQNFVNDDQIVELPESLVQYCSYHPLTNLLDFSRTSFDKAISLTPKKVTESMAVVSKWEIQKMDNLMKIVRGASPRPINEYTTEIGENWIKIGDVKSGEKYITSTAEKITKEGALKSREVNIGDFILSNSMSYGRPYICGIKGYVHDGWLVLSDYSNKMVRDYLYEILTSQLVQTQFKDKASGSVVDNLNIEKVKSVKIPVPPIEIQKQIVAECEVVDTQVETAKSQIERLKSEIDGKISNLDYPAKQLSSIAELNPSKSTIRHIEDEILVSFVEMASVSNDGYITSKVDKKLGDLKKGSYTYFAENDIIMAKVTPCMENGKCAIAKDLTNSIGMGSSEFHVIRANQEVNNKFLFAIINRQEVRKLAEQQMTGSSGLKRVPINFYASYKIPVPPIEIQNQIVTEIERLETQINSNQIVIDGAKELKQSILDKYLN